MRNVNNYQINITNKMHTITIKCKKCAYGKKEETFGEFLLGMATLSIYLWARNEKCNYCDGVGHFKFQFKTLPDLYDRNKQINEKLIEIYKKPTAVTHVYYMD